MWPRERRPWRRSRLSSHGLNGLPPRCIAPASVPDFLPTILRFHRPQLLDASIVPRIRIGNAAALQPHDDLYSNIAGVFAGRRRLTLFPPEQLPDLYPGPMDVTLAGVPISMIRLEDMDCIRHPRSRLALEHLQVAEPGPADALLIPSAWWHRADSLAALNVLVNDWWNPSQSPLSPRPAVRDIRPSQSADRAARRVAKPLRQLRISEERRSSRPLAAGNPLPLG